MPRSNKPRTLRDLNNHDDGRQNDEGGMPSTADSNEVFAGASNRRDAGLHDIYHIPTLSDADQARKMLERVVKEFRPIAERRGYVVLSVSELCCCNDGLDFRNTNGKKSRKLNKVSQNVWGYNRTMTRNGRKTHTIHLRLRHAQNHSRFLPYDDVAGTLAHELSHCVHGPHNDKFYKLMDDILEEHATLMASGSSVAGQAFAGQGHVLGGRPPSRASRENPQSLLGKGHTLGGDSRFTQWMSPREAAVAAAMARQRQQQLRLRGNRCCRPCVIADENEDEVQIIDVVPYAAAPPNRKRAPETTSELESKQPHKRGLSTTVIDLTVDDEKQKAKPLATTQWACAKCTFLNVPTTTEACEICFAPKA